MVVFDATRERMARGNNQRTGEIVLVPPCNLSPCLIKRQSLPPNLVPVLEIIFPLAIVSEIQANERTTANERKETGDDRAGLLLCHGEIIRGHV